MSAPLGVPVWVVDGAGNRFALVDLLDAGGVFDRAVASARKNADALTNVERGRTEDGLLLVGPGRDADGASATMVVVNRDGSRPEMCGNGLRCVAVHVGRRIGACEGVIATDAGPRAFEVLWDDGRAARVRVTMGEARAAGEARPAAAPGRTFHRVDVGNPHAVCIVGTDEDPVELARRLGPAVEIDAAFAPERTNVGFLRRRPHDPDANALELAVWERGVGLTDACGTGACAAAFAAVRAGLAAADRYVRVHLPGGPLDVRVPGEAGAALSLIGPAHVASSPVPGRLDRAGGHS
ncbi:MAG: diaminopimelate epimerase [Planctomycetota bacterium]